MALLVNRRVRCLREYHPELLPQEFFARQFFAFCFSYAVQRSLIDVGEAPLAVQGHKSFGDALEDVLDPLVGFPQLFLCALAFSYVAPDVHVAVDRAVPLLVAQGDGDPFDVHGRAVLCVLDRFGAELTPLGELSESLGALFLAQPERDSFPNVSPQHFFGSPTVHCWAPLFQAVMSNCSSVAITASWMFSSRWPW